MPEKFDPVFLTLAEVMEVHESCIREYGGSMGIRDFGLLESAVAVPQSGFGDALFHTDHAQVAAAYLFHLVSNHPFIDGNKRVGAASAVMFLKMNELVFRIPEDELVDITLAVATHAASKDDVAAFFRRSIDK